MNAALIFAGGTGQRMSTAARPKQFLELYGKPIIIYTLEVFENHPDIDLIVISCLAGWEEHLAERIRHFGITKVRRIVQGGATSQASKLNALHALRDLISDDDIVLMHDAVRPLVTPKLISDNIACVRENGNAITVDPFTETGIVSTDGRTVEATIERSRLYIGKAPQSFRFKDALWAHEMGREMPDAIAIDTCTLMAALGRPLHFVTCEPTNIKITTPSDYYVFKALYDLRESKEILGL